MFVVGWRRAFRSEWPVAFYYRDAILILILIKEFRAEWLVGGMLFGLSNNNNNKRPLTPKSRPPAGDEHAKLKT